jgi:CheY-like chemotaxis protein
MPMLYQAFSQEQIGYTRKFEGSGLGLALTKRFLELHDATIEVRSEKGKGSAFTIHIPPDWVVAAVPESPAVADESGTSPDMPAARPLPSDARIGGADGDPGDWAKPCVLVVEDDLETQTMMRAMLRERYRVLTADDAKEARRMLAFPGEKVRVVLMDLSLRGDEDGLTLTKALRTDERWRTLPIVAVTAHALSEDRDNALAAGCDAYLPKPVERARLLSVIQGFTA